MFYNIKKQKVQTSLDCVTCEHYNKVLRKCNGLNKVCFEYDEKTMTCIDGITKLPLAIKKVKGDN